MEYKDPNMAWMPDGDYDEYDVDRSIKRGCLRVLMIIAALVAALVVCVAFGSCTTVREVVTVERVRTDTLRLSRNIRDSVFLRDSVIVRENGDTCWVERWHTRIHETKSRDTVYLSRTDTLVSISERVKEVKKPPSWWQRMRMRMGDVAMVAAAGGAVVYVIRRRRRL